MIKNNIVKIGSYPYITKVARHSYKWLSILWEGGIYMAMIDTYRRNVVKKREDIAKLASDKAKEKEKIAKARAKIDSANATIRRTLGQDINASCGQLRRKKNEGGSNEDCC